MDNKNNDNSGCLQFFLAIVICFFWSLIYIDAIAHNTTLDENVGKIVFLILNAIATFFISKFTNYKILAYTFFKTSIFFSFFVFALIASIRWL